MALYVPSRCTADLPDEYREHHVAEEKMDGSRYVLYLGNGIDPYGRQDAHTLLSRRVSTRDGMHVDNTLNIPHITDLQYRMSAMGTVLDGEIFKDDFQCTTALMGCSPGKAVSRQEATGFVTFHAFDIMQFRNKDVRGYELADRRKILLEVVDRLDNPHVIPIEQYDTDFDMHFHRITSEGGEGLIIKDNRLGYGTGWAKKKKAYEVTCVVIGFTPGRGKYEGSVGALRLAVYMEDGTAYEVGKASGFNDHTRWQMSKDPDKYIGKCVDINTMRLNKPRADFPNGRLFQPTFHRWRDDYNPSDVTLEKLKSDMQKKAKSNRNKFWNKLL